MVDLNAAAVDLTGTPAIFAAVRREVAAAVREAAAAETDARVVMRLREIEQRILGAVAAAEAQAAIVTTPVIQPHRYIVAPATVTTTPGGMAQAAADAPPAP